MSTLFSPGTTGTSPAKKFAVVPSLSEKVLTQARSGREVIQDFVPLAESLEWELGQQYLRQRGNKAFISDASPVPYVINNDGSLSRHAAEVFFVSLREAEEAGSLEPEIFVLELGIGVGLFARFFLDHLRDICQRHHKDYYDRLCYVAADKSQRMLLDVLRHGVLSDHAGRYRVRLVDAMKPDADLPRDVAFQGRPGKPFRAVFLNYLLDCLPATVLRFDDKKVTQLCVRTCLARNVRLEDYSDLTPQALRDRVTSQDPRARDELLEVYGLFASEYDYRPVTSATIPYGEFALDYGRRQTKVLLHSHGAIHSLEKLLTLVHDDGFILVNDYGQTQVSREEDFEHQRFSLATFVGLNFPLLQTYFGEGDRCQWLEPSEGEARGIHSRLLGHKIGPAVRTRFLERFGQAALDQLQEPIQKARAFAKMGRYEQAAGFYQQGLERQPGNWVLLNEISMFLTFSLRDPKAGADMAKVALSYNPTCSSDLWSTLGDALYEGGRTAEARSAYLRALAINPSDVRARYNLAWTYTRDKDFPMALQTIAQALALDKTGEYRDRLLHKLNEVLAQHIQRNQQEYFWLINLVSRHAQSDKDPAPPDPVTLAAEKGTSAAA